MDAIKQYPRRFGKYVLIAPLAKGGMGEIHLAYSGRADLKKLCVIKTILGHLADDEFVARFVDEAKVVAKLSHGNLVPIFEAGQTEGQYFLAMEYIDGRDLRDVWNRLMATGRTCPLDVALYIVREICRGLAYVHNFEDLHLVHRDVSPPNVLISYTGEVRLTDFGVATSAIKLQKTAPGILLGKLSYMSPEQARNEAVDARADIYSVGVILWELLTGQRLFPPDKSQVERYERALNPVIVPPTAVNSALPPSVDLVTLRALAPLRDNRINDAELLRRELASLLAKVGPTTDAQTVQQLIKELYGQDIEKEREERNHLLESMAEEILELMGASGNHPAVVVSDSHSPDKGATLPGRNFEEEGTSLPRLAPGTLLGDRYRITELLGEGGMGMVYRATHVEIEKEVAVKVLHPVYSRMPDVVSRFRQEARAASRIGHPHIVDVFDSGTTSDGSIYFVMESLDGMDLGEMLDIESKLSVERAVRIATQVCEALAAAHDAGIVHRDLKPENIFLTTRDGSPDFVKVLDFGIAKNSEIEDTDRANLTYPGMAMGTPEYMAPEQAAGGKTDHRVDIYAAGALLYEMLVGQPPHAGSNLMAVLSRKASEPVVPPRELRPEVPEALEKLVLWSLRHDPEARPQTMSQMSYELNKLTRGRAGAVASVLGIPGLSGPPGGPNTPPELPQLAGATASSGDATMIVSRRWPWLVPVTIAVAATVTTGVISLRAMRRQAPLAASPDARGGVVTGRPTLPADAAMRLDGAGDEGRPGDAGGRPEDGAPAVDARPRVKSSSGGLRTQLTVARQHLLAGRFEDARRVYDAASRVPRLKGPALVGLAEVEFQLDHLAVARKYAEKAVQQGGGLKARLVLGNIHFKLRDYRRAVESYKAVLAVDRNNPEAKRNLAVAQQRLSQ